MKKKFSLGLIAFLQALGVMIYCGLVGLLFWRGDAWFGKIGRSYSGPLFFLTLFSTSVLVCALLVFGYPVFLFWDKKQAHQALKLVAFTAAWLTFFTFFLILLLLIF